MGIASAVKDILATTKLPELSLPQRAFGLENVGNCRGPFHGVRSSEKSKHASLTMLGCQVMKYTAPSAG